MFDQGFHSVGLVHKLTAHLRIASKQGVACVIRICKLATDFAHFLLQKKNKNNNFKLENKIINNITLINKFENFLLSF